MSPGAAAPFPWDDVLDAAFGFLRWPPDAVWRATPRELALALGPGGRTRAPGREDLDALLKAHPDKDT